MEVLKPIVLDETLKKTNEYLAQLCINTGGLDTVKKWSDIQHLVREGLISKYLEVGDQVVVERETGIVANASAGLSVTVDEDKFVEATHIAGNIAFEFTYDGGAWRYGEMVVELANYGITVSGTPTVDSFIVVHETASDLIFDVLDIDYDVPTDKNLKHSLTLGMRDVFTYGTIPFDAPEALYYCENELPAGTYNVTLNRGAYGGGTSEDGTYQFTLTKPVPAKGLIKHSSMGQWRSAYGQQYVLSGTFTTYNASYDTIETVATTLGSDGTSLGTTTASNPQYKTNDNLNFSERNGYGSNRYAHSANKKFMNSKAKGAGNGEIASWWYSSNKWDLPVRSTMAGFLHGIDPSFLDAIGYVDKRTALCVADGYGYEDTSELIFEQSRYEVFGSAENGIVETVGEIPIARAYQYWIDHNTNADRIKYQGATARYWWLRSPNSSLAHYERYVLTDGSLYYDGAGNIHGVVCACVIC